MKAIIKKIATFLKHLIFGYSLHFYYKPVSSALKIQLKNLKDIWFEKSYQSFGLERLIRLFLSAYQFISIGLYVRWFFGCFGFLWRKIGVELLVIAKLIFPISILLFNWMPIFLTPYIFGYLLLDTVFYIAGLIFLTDVYKGTTTYKRSLITLFCNYLEITLDFAVVYIYFDTTREDFFFT